MKRTVRNILILSVVTVINILIYTYASGSHMFLFSTKPSRNSYKLQELNIRKNLGGGSTAVEKWNHTAKDAVNLGQEHSIKSKIVDPGPIYNLIPESGKQVENNEIKDQLGIGEKINNANDMTNVGHQKVGKAEIPAVETKPVNHIHVGQGIGKPDIPVGKPDNPVGKPDNTVIKPDIPVDKPDTPAQNSGVFQVDAELLALSQGHHIFPHNFNLVMNHPEACHNSDGSHKDIFLVVFISTIHKNFDQRKAIRETWGSLKEVGGKKITTVFLLAKTSDKSLQKMVEEEDKQYKDLIMEDFQDTYKNLTLKTIMGMKWVSMYCPHAKYVMKTDDDMYVSYPNIVNYLSSHPDTQKGLAMGFLINGSPIRDPKSKWYMPRETYPGNRYPPFLSGTGYVMSLDVARRTYVASVDTPFLYLEDVFCATVWDKIGVKPKRHAEFHNWRTAYSFCRFKRIMTTHMVQPGEMRRIWNDQKTRKIKCSW
ncbi:beta-1,3-galactosyltransferase 1-like isoform X2 [Anneissia japonica]|uniref:beta-1,3-galactosyltransferase 1-like isoform X2 n=1 Tax=Anneissia japonica TaxID=1529436 RepID=UPI001425A2BE|nr:beta-1,3-galactosyltransferase 1-like isoform X2 [Anneissia japonica]